MFPIQTDQLHLTMKYQERKKLRVKQTKKNLALRAICNWSRRFTVNW